MSTHSAELLEMHRSVDARETIQMASANGDSPGSMQIVSTMRDGHVILIQSRLELFKNTEDYNNVLMLPGFYTIIRVAISGALENMKCWVVKRIQWVNLETVKVVKGLISVGFTPGSQPTARVVY